MKRLCFLVLVCVRVHGWGQVDTMVFENSREMVDYAFSNTTSSNLSTSFLTNRTLDLQEKDFDQYLVNDTNRVKGVNNLHLLTLLEWWDLSQEVNRDSILFPVFNHFYSLDEVRPLHIPLYLVDLDVATIKPDTWDIFKADASLNSFPSVNETDIIHEHIQTASIFLDSFAYENVFLDFNLATYFSNKEREVESITLTSGNEFKTLFPNIPLDISDWLGTKRSIEIAVLYRDGTGFIKKQEVEMLLPVIPKTLNTNWTNTFRREYFDSGLPITINNPEAKYSTYYACSDNKLRKPFIMVAGWGPHTDKTTINSDIGWPTSLGLLATQYNQDGLIENLHDEGFDVVLVQFFPPNASVLKNSVLLEKVINSINNSKFQNDSYQENIIMGFSAGSLATRLALQQMEKKHLEQNGPHPHTKLYISNDGEHGGANVPLGMQHAVEYLWRYEYNDLFLAPGMIGSLNIADAKTYALHYILNAPLSKELLHYFHTETGSGNNPGQGEDILRTLYLHKHTTNNHAKNGSRLGYPSFQRMISISNGSSTPNYNFSNFSSNQPPYPPQEGAIFFKQSGSLMGWVNRNFEATFLRHGVSRVFYYEYKQLFKGWKVAYEAKTSNPLILDNAPGGIIFINQNPIVNINQQLQSELTGAPDIKENYLFAFTPTVLTHDVKDLSGSLNNGFPDYNFKAHFLMFDNETTVSLSNPISNASNYFGYPHLGYPGNHYDYTVFDALFCWDQNTEHLIGNVKDPNSYSGMESSMKGVLKNFVVEEAEPDNIYLQNLRIGFYTRPNFEYRVDYEAGNIILLGNHVTQKTDFVDFTVESNAVVDAQAINEIHFTPGVHITNGAKFHAHIGDITCEKSSPTNGSEPENNGLASLRADFGLTDSKPVQFISVYPNPSNSAFSINWDEILINEEIAVQVFDLSGKEVFKAVTVVNSAIIHGLKAGFYIVKLKNKGVCVSKNLTVE